MGRDLVIDTKQAYLLKLFQTTSDWRHIYPSPVDSGIVLSRNYFVSLS